MQFQDPATRCSLSLVITITTQNRIFAAQAATTDNNAITLRKMPGVQLCTFLRLCCRILE